MTWDAYNRRKEVLREILEVADRRRNDITLIELLDTVDGGRTAFANETELLYDIQMSWFQRLSGQMDRLVTEGVDTPEIMAITAWVNAAGEMPGARALLDAHADTEALRKGLREGARVPGRVRRCACQPPGSVGPWPTAAGLRT